MNRRRLIVSIHDVAPPFASGVRQLLEELDRRSIRPRVLKVVPNHGGRSPLAEDPDLCELLRSEAAAGSEIVAHGWTHHTRGPMRGSLSARLRGAWFAPEAAEFLSLPKAEARESARRARREIADVLGVEPQGFCAPAWLINKAGRSAVEAAGYRYLLEQTVIRDLRTGETVATPWQGFMGVGPFHEWLVQVGNGAIAVQAAITRGGLSRCPVVKLFLHPQRLQDNAALQRVLDRLEALAVGREIVTAAQLLAGAEIQEPAPRPRRPSPLVSVVIPALNEEACIARAIESVGSQQYPPDRLECLVVDNDSGDATAETVLDLARRWESSPETTPRLSLVREPRRGVGPAKNRGAAAAGGEVLVFLDADSTLEPTVARDAAAAWAGGSRGGSIAVLADSDDFWERGFFRALEFCKRTFGIHGQMFYLDRRLFHRLGGFRQELRLAEDLDLMRRAGASLRSDGRRLQRLDNESCIRTSPRRLRAMPWRLGMLWMFVRWSLGFAGIGRRWYRAGGPAPGAPPRSARLVRGLTRPWLRLVLFSAGSHAPGQPAGLLWLWWLWDGLYIRWHRLRPVSPGGTMLYGPGTYRGSRPIDLPDGTRIAKGDPVCRVHLRNDPVARSGNSGVSRRTWGVIKGLRVDLELLARRAAEGTLTHRGNPVKALTSTTLLFRGARRLGFEVWPRPESWRLELERMYMLGLLDLYLPGRIPDPAGSFEVGEMWMSRAALLARYQAARRAPGLEVRA